MLDLGAWSQPHGDHAHSYTKDPKRSEIAFEGDHPGHVTHHDGRALLWADGTGEVQEFAAEHLLAGATPKTETWKAKHAHHGVAAPTHDGGMLVAVGTEDEGEHGEGDHAGHDHVDASHSHCARPPVARQPRGAYPRTHDRHSTEHQHR